MQSEIEIFFSCCHEKKKRKIRWEHSPNPIIQKRFSSEGSTGDKEPVEKTDSASSDCSLSSVLLMSAVSVALRRGGHHPGRNARLKNWFHPGDNSLHRSNEVKPAQLDRLSSCKCMACGKRENRGLKFLSQVMGRETQLAGENFNKFHFLAICLVIFYGDLNFQHIIHWNAIYYHISKHFASDRRKKIGAFSTENFYHSRVIFS